MHFICLLGRQPNLSLAELERIYGADYLERFSDTTAIVDAQHVDVQKLGGVSKAGQVIFTTKILSWSDLSKKIIHHYSQAWQSNEGKQTLGISVYDWPISPRDIQKTGLVLKSSLKKQSVSLRLIPNGDTALGTATSHHNKLGLAPNKTELIIVRGKHKIVVAESVGAQNISALAARDQGRPKRDAFVGMLPPKLALLMLNLALGDAATSPSVSKTILDPFCGTGVVLQEALLRGLNVYGTDLSEKMIDYSQQNLAWLQSTHSPASRGSVQLHQGDAMDTKWQTPVDFVVGETYLGQPFSAPPTPAKLTQVRGNCNHIISEFLGNLAAQLPSGTPLCLGVPAWRSKDGSFTHLPLINKLGELGYQHISLRHTPTQNLLYYREDQVVARQLLILVRR